MTTGHPLDLYEYHVRGELSGAILNAFPDLRATVRNGETVLRGQVPDQAALFGVLERIEALGIQLIEVRLVRSRRDGASHEHRF